MSLPHRTGWRAQLTLEVAATAGRCVVRHRHVGPLLLQRPFYPEGRDCCHLYVLHPPGGIVGGDELCLEGRVADCGHALVTTPAANKLYRSLGATAWVTNTWQVADGATLEWLPQETIAFTGSRSQLVTRVELAPEGRFLGWEILCLGRPAAGEVFGKGVLHSTLDIRRAGRPLAWEVADYRPEQPVMTAPWGLGGWPVTAALYCAGAWPGCVDGLRRALDPTHWSVSQRLDLLTCRYLGPSTAGALGGLRRVWGLLRPEVLGRAPCPPRIWNT